jgi:hypothetical protein
VDANKSLTFHRAHDGPDEADRAVVERVVAERAGRDENVERVLRELVTCGRSRRELFCLVKNLFRIRLDHGASGR